MSRPNFGTPSSYGSPVNACQWSHDVYASAPLWCGDAPAYELLNVAGKVFLSCVEHAALSRTDPRARKYLASMRSIRVSP